MSVTTASNLSWPATAEGSPARLAVAWQHPLTRTITPVGLLSCLSDGFVFRYLARVAEVEGFRPLLGFDDLAATYRSTALFPLFAQRIMRAGRPDHDRYLEVLGLPAGAGDWDVLARSHGRRQGDDLRFFAEPGVQPDGATEVTFFVSGIRHRLNEAESVVEGALAGLAPGDELVIRPQPDNPANHRALLLLGGGEVAVGWVPDALLDHVHCLDQPQVTVLHVADRAAPVSYRLRVRLLGQAAPGYQPFGGPDWAPYGASMTVSPTTTQ